MNEDVVQYINYRTVLTNFIVSISSFFMPYLQQQLNELNTASFFYGSFGYKLITEALILKSIPNHLITSLDEIIVYPDGTTSLPLENTMKDINVLTVVNDNAIVEHILHRLKNIAEGIVVQLQQLPWCASLEFEVVVNPIPSEGLFPSSVVSIYMKKKRGQDNFQFGEIKGFNKKCDDFPLFNFRVWSNPSVSIPYIMSQLNASYSSYSLWYCFSIFASEIEDPFLGIPLVKKRMEIINKGIDTQEKAYYLIELSKNIFSACSSKYSIISGTLFMNFLSMFNINYKMINKGVFSELNFNRFVEDTNQSILEHKLERPHLAVVEQFTLRDIINTYIYETDKLLKEEQDDSRMVKTGGEASFYYNRDPSIPIHSSDMDIKVFISDKIVKKELFSKKIAISTYFLMKFMNDGHFFRYPTRYLFFMFNNIAFFLTIESNRKTMMSMKSSIGSCALLINFNLSFYKTDSSLNENPDLLKTILASVPPVYLVEKVYTSIIKLKPVDIWIYDETKKEMRRKVKNDIVLERPDGLPPIISREYFIYDIKQSLSAIKMLPVDNPDPIRTLVRYYKGKIYKDISRYELVTKGNPAYDALPHVFDTITIPEDYHQLIYRIVHQSWAKDTIEKIEYFKTFTKKMFCNFYTSIGIVFSNEIDFFVSMLTLNTGLDLIHNKKMSFMYTIPIDISDFELLNYESVASTIQPSFAIMLSKLSFIDHAFIEWYAADTTNYKEINKKLREPTKKNQLSFIEDFIVYKLTEILNKGLIQENTVLYRGEDRKIIKNAESATRIDSFYSTSHQKTSALYFTGKTCCLFQLKLKEHIHGIYLPMIGLNNINENEEEVLFPPGIYTDNGHIIIEHDQKIIIQNMSHMIQDMKPIDISCKLTTPTVYSTPIKSSPLPIMTSTLEEETKSSSPSFHETLIDIPNYTFHIGDSVMIIPNELFLPCGIPFEMSFFIVGVIQDEKNVYFGTLIEYFKGTLIKIDNPFMCTITSNYLMPYIFKPRIDLPNVIHSTRFTAAINCLHNLFGREDLFTDNGGIRITQQTAQFINFSQPVSLDSIYDYMKPYYESIDEYQSDKYILQNALNISGYHIKEKMLQELFDNYANRLQLNGNFIGYIVMYQNEWACIRFIKDQIVLFISSGVGELQPSMYESINYIAAVYYVGHFINPLDVLRSHIIDKEEDVEEDENGYSIDMQVPPKKEKSKKKISTKSTPKPKSIALEECPRAKLSNLKNYSLNNYCKISIMEKFISGEKGFDYSDPLIMDYLFFLNTNRSYEENSVVYPYSGLYERNLMLFMMDYFKKTDHTFYCQAISTLGPQPFESLEKILTNEILGHVFMYEGKEITFRRLVNQTIYSINQLPFFNNSMAKLVKIGGEVIRYYTQELGEQQSSDIDTKLFMTQMQTSEEQDNFKRHCFSYIVASLVQLGEVMKEIGMKYNDTTFLVSDGVNPPMTGQLVMFEHNRIRTQYIGKEKKALLVSIDIKCNIVINHPRYPQPIFFSMTIVPFDIAFSTDYLIPPMIQQRHPSLSPLPSIQWIINDLVTNLNNDQRAAVGKAEKDQARHRALIQQFQKLGLNEVVDYITYAEQHIKQNQSPSYKVFQPYTTQQLEQLVQSDYVLTQLDQYAFHHPVCQTLNQMILSVNPASINCVFKLMNIFTHDTEKYKCQLANTF